MHIFFEFYLININFIDYLNLSWRYYSSKPEFNLKITVIYCYVSDSPDLIQFIRLNAYQITTTFKYTEHDVFQHKIMEEYIKKYKK